MNGSRINIDFEALSKAFQQYIRRKAKLAGSTIVYKSDNHLIEEDPKTSAKKILKDYLHAD